MTQFEEKIIIHCLDLSGFLSIKIDEIESADIEFFHLMLKKARKFYTARTFKQEEKNKYHFDLLLNLINASEEKVLDCGNVFVKQLDEMIS